MATAVVATPTTPTATLRRADEERDDDHEVEQEEDALLTAAEVQRLRNDVIAGISGLVSDSVVSASHIAEELHLEILNSIPYVPRLVSRPIGMFSSAIYSAVRLGATGISYSVNYFLMSSAPSPSSSAGQHDGSGNATPASPLSAPRCPAVMTAKKETLLCVLNGVIGDHLARARNPLAIQMTLRRKRITVDVSSADTLRAHLVQHIAMETKRKQKKMTMRKNSLTAVAAPITLDSDAANVASPQRSSGNYNDDDDGAKDKVADEEQQQQQQGPTSCFPHRVVVMVHGLCANDSWSLREAMGHDHGDALENVEAGIIVLHVRYNSGLHISENGEAFCNLLCNLARNWPVPLSSSRSSSCSSSRRQLLELHLVGHSMGGLISRSAIHIAQQRARAQPLSSATAGSSDSSPSSSFLPHLRTLICLGSPHGGSPLERLGNRFHDFMASGDSMPSFIARYITPLARLGAIRSAGVTDLRFGNIVHADWQGIDRFANDHEEQSRRRNIFVQLPGADGVQNDDGASSIKCYAIAATLGIEVGDLVDSTVMSDGIVPVPSALGKMHPDHVNADDLKWTESVVLTKTGHLALLSSPAVLAKLKQWLDM